MGPGFFIFFQDEFPNDGGTAYDPALEHQRQHYRRKAKTALAREKAEKLNDKKRFKKELITLEVERMLADQQGEIRQKEETELKLLEVSESLLLTERDLVEIGRKRAKIDLIARIMRDDDELMIILYG